MEVETPTGGNRVSSTLNQDLQPTPNRVLELTAHQSLCLQYGAYGPYFAPLGQTRAWLIGRSSTRC